jgi:hypothetical protein
LRARINLLDQDVDMDQLVLILCAHLQPRVSSAYTNLPRGSGVDRAHYAHLLRARPD